MSTTEQAHDDPIMTRADIAARLDVSRETVRKWIKAKRLPEPDVALSRKTVGWKRSTLAAAGVNL